MKKGPRKYRGVWTPRSEEARNTRTAKKGGVYLGNGCLDFSYRKSGGSCFLFFKGGEVCTTQVVSHVSYWALDAGNTSSSEVKTSWSNWKPCSTGQEDCDERSQVLSCRLKDGESIIIAGCAQNQLDVYYRFTFRQGRLKFQEVATFWYDGGESCQSWWLGNKEVSQEAFDAFLNNL